MRHFVILVILLLAACSTPDDDMDPAPGPDTGRTQVLPLSGLNHDPQSMPSLRFELPTDAAYQAVSTRGGGDRPLVRTWRAPAAGGSCVVIAGDQPDFRGAFPAAAIAAFRAGREFGGTIEANEPVEAVPGTTAGVGQRSRYPLRPGEIDGEQGVLVVRQYLTDDSALISLSAAGPAGAVDTCRLEEITSTLSAQASTR